MKVAKTKTQAGCERRTASELLPLYNGDSMNQAEFHRRYEAYPNDQRFELIGGIVYMASPLKRFHATYHSDLDLLLSYYRAMTPGTETANCLTSILGEQSEPQPDLLLRILTECGGLSWYDDDDYLHGPSELLAEISHSSRAIDLNRKRDDYEKAGVLESMVLSVEEPELHWFHFPSGKPILPDKRGICKSRVFPGLWIDREALLAQDSDQTLAVLYKGLASREHAAFVKQLAAARKKS